MEESATRVSVVGAGVMGTALAISFDRAGRSVSLCGTEFDVEIIDSIERSGSHPQLHEVVPSSISVFQQDEWQKPIAESDLVVIGVASPGVRPVVRESAKYVGRDAIWGIGSKGWDPETAQPLSAVVAEEGAGHPVVIIVGPSLAGELAGGTPTGLVCASSDISAAETVARAIRSKTVAAFVTDDVAGVEVGAALKNVLAIAVGMCDGLSDLRGAPMANTKAAIFSRGLIEMGRLAQAMGGRQETVLGLAGAGDLFVTVLGGRNGRFGRLVGAGLTPKKAFEEMGTTVEGYDNAHQAVALASRFDLNLPIVRMVHNVLYEGLPVEDAIRNLMSAPVEREL